LTGFNLVRARNNVTIRHAPDNAVAPIQHRPGIKGGQPRRKGLRLGAFKLQQGVCGRFKPGLVPCGFFPQMIRLAGRGGTVKPPVLPRQVLFFLKEHVFDRIGHAGGLVVKPKHHVIEAPFWMHQAPGEFFRFFPLIVDKARHFGRQALFIGLEGIFQVGFDRHGKLGCGGRGGRP